MTDTKKDAPVFSMEDLKVYEAMDLKDAKEAALAKLAASTANASNKKQIADVISKSRTVGGLLISLSNHILAHPSEGLKVGVDNLPRAITLL